MPRSLSVVLGSAVLVAGIGCADLTDSQPPSVTTTSVRKIATLARMLSIQLDRPSSVHVTYTDDSGEALQVVSERVAREHQVLLPRLRAGTRYRFEVRAEADRHGGKFVTGEFFTDELPADLASIHFTATGRPSHPLTLLEFPTISLPDAFNGFVIVDTRGRVVWYFRTQGWATGATRRSNGNFVFLDNDIGLLEVTPAGDVVNTLPQEPDGRTMHHDVVALPGRAVLFLAQERQLVNDTLVTGEAIWKWIPETGATRMLWSAFDHLSPTTDRNARYVATDWLHANSLAVGPRGNMLVSFNRLNQIISIAPDFESLEWRLGGVNATMAVSERERFSGQHTASEIRPRRVLLFDNGLERTEDRYSRAVEFELTSASVTKVWEFRPKPDNWSRFVGSARRLANGNTFVTFGVSEGIAESTGPVEVYEVTPRGDVRWHLVVSGHMQLVYRATPLCHVGVEVDAKRRPRSRC